MVFRVKNRDFQRAAGQWLQKAREGDTVLIVNSKGPTLTLRADDLNGSGKRAAWDEHFKWLREQPPCEENPVDEIRRDETR